MGWRYLLFALGGLTLLLWALRFFVFTLFESPRFLIGLGKDGEAVAIIHKIAEYNGTATNLSVEDLTAATGPLNQVQSPHRKVVSDSAWYTMGHIRALFATPKIAFSTSILILVWGTDLLISDS